jgi:SAM-dependent methyltransferase
VAQANPKAQEIVAVDLSERSLSQLRLRYSLAKLSLVRSRIPRVRTVVADLNRWQPETSFDYILASNVLHHVEDPAALLVRLSSWLRPGGALRVVTYPKRSRLWMRETSAWLKKNIPNWEALDGKSLLRACHQAFDELPTPDPIRACFESQPETAQPEGLADAFFHPCENPLSPLEWEAASHRAGLELFAEDQTLTSRSSFLVELLPATAALSPWERLQILDDSLELCANPVLWFRKVDSACASPEDSKDSTGTRCIPSRTQSAAEEMLQGLRVAHALLGKVGLTALNLLSALEKEVGPRVTAQGQTIRGLSITEYPFLRTQLELELGVAQAEVPQPPSPELEGLDTDDDALDDLRL